ncbi:hypothetical protein [Defluviitalea phaphyphila]|uniref:hypothetical protein n=1 Tax=Defluviitalea phaphyphila TaxID=1473580 RepID=UPI0007307CF4|nr:hypothetical protein [Defluviitalea phaphyphila]
METNSRLYCMECRQFVPVRDVHDCPSEYFAAVDREMVGIVDRLYKMGITPMIAVWSAIDMGDIKDCEYLLTVKVDIERRISEAVLGELPSGWKYHWETVTADMSELHMIAYVEHWYNFGFDGESVENRIGELIKEFEAFLDTRDSEAVKALLLLMEV